jgi:hypothetical protein
VKILVTTARMPFAIGLIRRLGEAGHEVLASDTYASIHDHARVRDADTGWHDHLPLLYSFLALAHHERMRLRERKQLMVAMSEDVCWDGEPIPDT